MPLDTDKNRPIATTAHWGTYYAEVENGRLTGLRDYEKDSSPSIIGQGILEALDDKVRVRRPMVRKGFLENGKSSNRKLRGKEPFVAVSWEKALDLAAGEIDRVRNDFGNKSIFGGSYGWASSGRFHHAQSQVHRFLNTIGGYVAHKNSYSHAAAEVILPHIVAEMKPIIVDQATQWPDITLSLIHI